ncbi:hypothetical protein DI396_12755 [Litorivita pollutaquae]|uniref:Uncharacterized protein n=1 Tax=Litorivita pollutaquae TaxID=2200892 RepID=A0A2V4MX60_9RHOB|nr:hypothetical protein [Litorivita pollutaquae]OUS19840.1 hypothetical protein A9Q95_12480 [Rhodobacterales bacterium 59_46_T64]PYC47074.1 hypothetical protein DI396_12755 [Litorivita pollutaquae]
MHTDKLQLDDLRYNPALSAFEANVTLHAEGEDFIYPCQMAAPLDAPFRTIALGLSERARLQHKAARQKAMGIGAMRMSRKSSAEERVTTMLCNHDTPRFAA